MNQMDINGKKQSLKSMNFNRYLMVRYATAGFFFINLYWLIALTMVNSGWLAIPAILVLVMLPAIVEQVKLYGKPTNAVPWTKNYYRIQIFINLILIIVTTTPFFKELFPFMKGEIQGRMFVIGVLIIGIGIAEIVLHRLSKIQLNKDRHYLRICQYQKALHI